MIFSLLCDTTEATIRQIAVTDITGRESLIFRVYFPNKLLISKPSPMGTITTCIMDKNIALASTLTDVLR